MRKILLILLGVVILILAVFFANRIANRPKPVLPGPEKVAQTVFVDTVYNTNIPIMIPATGTLVAKNRLELYAEVQGLFQSSAKDFKPGETYQKGQTLIQMDAAEFYASVQSARSDLYNLIASLMPDLRLDYPDSYDKWQRYLNSFDVNKNLAQLPEVTAEQERFFITGRQVYTNYFTIKNLEERLEKFRITAPFSGVLTEALVTKGTLIRSGQKLGEFIDPSIFEMEVSVSRNFIAFLEVGKKVSLQNLTKTETYEGEISRINARVDQATQTVKVFIDVKGSTLKEGMYLESEIFAKEEENAFEIPRKLLVNENQLYVVRDSLLDLMDVTRVYATEKNVVVKDIPDGTIILSAAVPGAYAGQIVKIYQEKTETE
jgi:multidrug efflux pump subunit AcrA (membrane-fusion protein)